MFEHFDPAARATLDASLEEARRRGDRRLNTEHFLLGILRDPASSEALGTTAEHARATLDELDRAALAAIGFRVPHIDRPPTPASKKHTPFSSGMRALLARAVTEARQAHSRRIRPEHLTLAVLGCEKPDPAAELMDRLAIDRAAVRERLRAV